MKFRYIFYLIFLGTFSSFGQNYTISWQRTIGGNNSDKLTKMITTADGGAILCGYSNSDISGDKAQNSYNGTYDFWVVKIGGAGSTQWSKTYGGMDRDLSPSIIQTSDGGYLLGGSSISTASGTKTEDAINKSFDYWLLKLDKKGNVIWDNTIGGIQFDKFATVLETSTAYFVCGSSNSIDGNDKTVDNEGSSLTPDYWLIKLNKSGTVLWDSVYGSTNRDELTAAATIDGGGLILAGSSYSPRGGNKRDDYLGNNDFWILKIDSLGNRIWDRTLGGKLSDNLTCVAVVGNIGYVFGGYSNSPASFNKTDNCKGGVDYWILRTDKSGAPIWDKTFGGGKEDYLTSIQFISGGTYLVGGYSNSGMSGDKTSVSKGGYDFWTLQLDKDGNLLQQSDWGGTGDDYLSDYVPNGTEYMLAGTSNSPNGKDKKAGTVGNTGQPDYWVFKVSPTGAIAKNNAVNSIVIDNKEAFNKNQLLVEITPNPVKDVLHINYNTNNVQNALLSVYNNNGKLINQQTLSQSAGTYTLDVAAQSAGIYYAVLKSGSSTVTKKFIKN